MKKHEELKAVKEQHEKSQREKEEELDDLKRKYEEMKDSSEKQMFSLLIIQIQTLNTTNQLDSRMKQIEHPVLQKHTLPTSSKSITAQQPHRHFLNSYFEALSK